MHMKLVAVLRACSVMIPKHTNRLSRAEKKRHSAGLKEVGKKKLTVVIEMVGFD